MKRSIALFASLAATFSTLATADTLISYQGMLGDNSQPATGVYDFSFRAFSTDTGGSPLAVSTNLTVGVTNGLFTAFPDFGAIFNSQPVWLEISVRTNGAASFTLLGGRQRIASTPKAVHAATSDQAQVALSAEVSAISTAALQNQAVTASKIADSTIVNANIAGGAAIADTKLATISTVGKVANSATTATSDNVPDTIVARNGAGDIAAGLISGNGLDVTGFVRSGSEADTAEPPLLPGLVIRRFDSSVTNNGSVVARTDNCRLVRDGTTAGLRVDYSASDERLSIHAIGLSVFGTNVLFRTTITPAATGSIQVFNNAQRVVHADITFGNVYAEGEANVTQVFMNRYDNGAGTSDFYMTGTIISSYNQ